MSYCFETGISHSEFLEWTPEDRAKILAFQLEKSLRCQMCGTAPWEWDEKQGGSKYAYEPEHKFCKGCYIKNVSAQTEDTMPGTTVTLVKLSKTEKARRLVGIKKRLARDKEDNLEAEEDTTFVR